MRTSKTEFSITAAAQYPALLVLGLGGWLLPDPGFRPGLWVLLLNALAEELLFRFVLQESLYRRFNRKLIYEISWANVLTSIVFAAAHLLSQPPLWAGAVFFPSLVFGWTWEKYRNIAACTLLHFFYNFCFFYRPEFMLRNIGF